MPEKPYLYAPKVMRRLLYTVAFALLPLWAAGQSVFTQFDWNVLRIDSVLPTYTEVVPLETDYRLFDYSVRVEYPEWTPLTKDEAMVADCHAGSLADTLTIYASVGVSRGQGLLDIRFIPVVRHDGGYRKLLSGKVVITPRLKPRGAAKAARAAGKVAAMARASGQRWAAHSVLREGRWVKISVAEDGIYKLSDSQLRSMGFAPQRVRVYGYGGHRQDEVIDADADWDDLEEVSLLRTADGYLFHANGLVHWNGRAHVVNHYARAACYFVTEADSAAAAFPRVRSTAVGLKDIATFAASAVHDPQEYAWFQGGRQLFENYDYATGGSRTYKLTLPAYAADAGNARLSVSFSAANDEPTQVTPTFNGTPLTAMTIAALANEYAYASLTSRNYSVTAPLTENTLRFSATSGRHARLNYFELTYTGSLKIDAARPCIQFAHQPDSAAETLCIEYADGQQPQLWRLAEPGSPATLLEGAAADTTDAAGVRRHVLRVTVEDDGYPHRYAALDVAASYPQPATSAVVQNQDLHAADSLDMVIITPASGIFDEQAQRLAALHRQWDGLRVGVFRADQIYNEFSSGTPDATAYRRFLKMLYDRAADKATDAPRYLLLFGDAAWDNRMLSSAWQNYQPENFLLAYESENSTSDTDCYIMEDYFGLLDDGEGGDLTHDKTDVGVGRFPVRTVAEARAMVDKVEAYLRSAQAGAWKNVVCFLGDDGDNNDHLKKADQVAEEVTGAHPELEVRKVMWDAYQRESTGSGNRYPQVQQIIKNQMEEGALMMNYTGHAATYCISHEQVLRIEDFAAFSSPRLPLWVTAACDVQPFDTQKENIGETALLNERGAAIAVYGTTRTVYASANIVVNRAFCDAVFGTDELGRPNRLGDAVRHSKVYTIDNYLYYAANKLHFALLGDPALRIAGCSAHVVLDSINGVAVGQLPDGFTLHAGGRARLTGHIEDADGHAATDFQGAINVRLYDSKRTVTCLNNAGADNAFTFNTYDRILYSSQDSVCAGRFALTCPIPLDIAYSDAPGRVLFYAISNDRATEANGYCEDFLLGGTETNLTDSIGPHIVAYLDNDSFENGGAVGTTPFFVALLEDESGINTSGNGIGHDLELIIDGDPAMTYALNDYYTAEFGNYRRGTVAFSIPALNEGEHSLLFRAWDTQNNASTAALTFHVDRTKEVNVLSLTASVSPATTQTSFILSYDRPGSPCQFTIEVFDFTGRLLWNHSETAANASATYTVPWNLTTGSGFPLGSGVYLYRARVRCDDSEVVTKAQKIIVKSLRSE